MHCSTLLVGIHVVLLLNLAKKKFLESSMISFLNIALYLMQYFVISYFNKTLNRHQFFGCIGQWNMNKKLLGAPLTRNCLQHHGLCFSHEFIAILSFQIRANLKQRWLGAPHRGDHICPWLHCACFDSNNQMPYKCIQQVKRVLARLEKELEINLQLACFL